MKKILTVLIFISFICTVSAQSRNIPFSISYYSPFGNQFGGRIGTSLPIKKWEVSKNDHIHPNHLVLSPQLGFFSRPKVHRNYLFNLEMGVEKKRKDRKFYLTPSIGLGYLISSHFESSSVNLGTGKISRQMETQTSLLPTLSLEIGWQRNTFAYYAKPFYGRKISINRENSGFFGFDLGFRFNIHTSHKE